ncbi:MAG: ABC transporter permease [Planctomycetota bacterium]
MYKLFLSLRYLRKRIIAYFAVAAVTLCVAMLVIVISVMNGFLDKIEQAAKGLFGDVVVSTGQQWGMADYDKFIERIEKLDEVEAASPYIYCYAALRLKAYPEDPQAPAGPADDPPYRRRILQDYREGVQAVGIRLPERAAVSDFEEGLLVQQGDENATWDPEIDQILQANLRLEQFVRSQLELLQDDDGASSQGRKSQLYTAIDFYSVVNPRLRELIEQRTQQKVRTLEEKLQAALAANDGQPSEASWAIADEILDLVDLTPLRPIQQRAILGGHLPGLSFRTEDGELVNLWIPGRKVLLYVLPLQEMTASAPTPEVAELTVVDLSRTGVHNIDTSTVYVPFDLLQRLNKMEDPKRCSQIHVKVAGGRGDEAYLRAVAGKINRLWAQFRQEYPRPPREGSVVASTWREVQAGLIEPIQSQRTLVVVMFGIISTVAVFLIFAIFYMVVLQKTKDIGILKSVGASAPGVAGIFLMYGAIIGLVGAILGTLLGAWFVHNINPIHDWVGDTFGLTVWRMETFMFDTIPSNVDWSSTIWILLGSIGAGLAGALIPAIRAATMQPVEALRYE